MPAFVKTKKDEKRWANAKKEASKTIKESEGDSYWKLVNHVYHKMKKTEVLLDTLYKIKDTLGKDTILLKTERKKELTPEQQAKINELIEQGYSENEASILSGIEPYERDFETASKRRFTEPTFSETFLRGLQNVANDFVINAEKQYVESADPARRPNVFLKAHQEEIYNDIQNKYGEARKEWEEKFRHLSGAEKYKEYQKFRRDFQEKNKDLLNTKEQVKALRNKISDVEQKYKHDVQSQIDSIVQGGSIDNAQKYSEIAEMLSSAEEQSGYGHIENNPLAQFAEANKRLVELERSKLPQEKQEAVSADVSEKIKDKVREEPLLEDEIMRNRDGSVNWSMIPKDQRHLVEDFKDKTPEEKESILELPHKDIDWGSMPAEERSEMAAFRRLSDESQQRILQKPYKEEVEAPTPKVPELDPIKPEVPEIKPKKDLSDLIGKFGTDQQKQRFQRIKNLKHTIGEKPVEPKIEVPKVEAPKVETPKIETPKIETPTVKPIVEPAKPEIPTAEVPKPETKIEGEE